MAKDIKRHLSHLKSSGTTAPAASDLIYGEIAVGYKDGEERLYIKNSSDNIVTIGVPAGDILNCMVTDTSGDSAVSASINACSPTGRTVTVAHSTAAGYKHVPAGGSSGQFLGWDSAGTAKWVANPNTDTKVTSVDNHYTPTATTANTKTSSASGGNALAWSSPIVTGVTLSGDAKGHITAVAVSSAKLPANPNTDTKVTAVGNHYTPTSSATISKTASSTTSASWGSSDFVTGITLYKDAAGHITDMAVDSLQLPANPNTNTWRAVNVNGASKYTTETASTNVLSFTSGSTNGTIGVSGTDVKVTGFLPYETGLTSTSNEKLPTSKAVADYVTQQMASALTYKGAISSNDTLKPPYKTGDLWVVSSAGTYAGKACEVGDYLIAKNTVTAGTSVVNADWDAINGENQVENKSATLAWNSAVTIATVDGTNITAKLPTNPNTWRNVKVNGTEKLGTGTGTGALEITSGSANGTISVAGTDVAVKGLGTAAYKAEGYFAGSGHTHATTIASDTGTSQVSLTHGGKFKLTAGGTSYIFTMPSDSNSWRNVTVNGTEKLGTGTTTGALDFTSGSTNGTISVEGVDVKVTGLGGAAYLSTGTTAGTVAAGNHNHSGTYATNTFSKVKINAETTTIDADSTGDTLTISGGTFISLTSDATNDKFTINVNTGTTSSTVAVGNHSHSSYVNQNAFSNIKVGSTTVAADTATDTVEFAVDSNGAISITGDATNDKVTFGLGNIVCGDYA